MYNEMYAVIVNTTADAWTTHSTHQSQEEAQDQADMVHGRVVRLGTDGKPADSATCPACGGDPMQCCCDTPWSS